MRLTVLSVVPALLIATAVQAHAQVCIAVDEAHDTLSRQERAAAVLYVARQFELEGETVVEGDCPALYRVSHIALGNSILVKLTGPRGEREGSALGLEDLPALYSQMVRSLITGRPMAGFNVVDRTNVTAAQSSTERVATDAFWYARLGYGGVFGDRTYGTPAIGFGRRIELDSFGIDVSFLNFQAGGSDRYSTPYGAQSYAMVGSLLKLEGLYFFNPTANKTFYAGGGASWGNTSFGEGWHGSGLQGELTAGYELPRASTLRAFIELNALLPFYNVSTIRYPVNYNFRQPAPLTTEHRYAPSVTVSVGFGWQRDRHRRD